MVNISLCPNIYIWSIQKHLLSTLLYLTPSFRVAASKYYTDSSSTEAACASSHILYYFYCFIKFIGVAFINNI